MEMELHEPSSIASVVQLNDQDLYNVERIVDVRWDIVDGKEISKYRVRWEGYPPSEDTWESVEQFIDVKSVLTEFENRYALLLEEHRRFQLERGIKSSERDIRYHVNVMSDEIEEIIQKRKWSELDSEECMMYSIHWKGRGRSHEDITWETEDGLCHARDKLAAFLERCCHARGTRIKHTSGSIAMAEMEHKRRVNERKFWEQLENGEMLNRGDDIYSGVKSGRARNLSGKKEQPVLSTLENEFNDHEFSNVAHFPKKERKKSQKKVGEKSPLKRKVAQTTKKFVPSVKIALGKSHSGNVILKSENNVSRTVYKALDSLLLFDPKILDELDQRDVLEPLCLNKEEFFKAVAEDDRDALQRCFDSRGTPDDLDFPGLLLMAARYGNHSAAMILMSKVSDLSVKDKYGDTALIISARRGDICFAHQLLIRGASLTDKSEDGKTVDNVASYYGHHHFLSFLKLYRKQQENMPGSVSPFFAEYVSSDSESN